MGGARADVTGTCGRSLGKGGAGGRRERVISAVCGRSGEESGRLFDQERRELLQDIRCARPLACVCVCVRARARLRMCERGPSLRC